MENNNQPLINAMQEMIEFLRKNPRLPTFYGPWMFYGRMTDRNIDAVKKAFGNPTVAYDLSLNVLDAECRRCFGGNVHSDQAELVCFDRKAVPPQPEEVGL